MEDDNGAYGLGHAGDSLPRADARPEADSSAEETGLLSDEQVSSLRGLLDFLSQEDDEPVGDTESLTEASELDDEAALPDPSGVLGQGDWLEPGDLAEARDLADPGDLAEQVELPDPDEGDGWAGDEGDDPADRDEDLPLTGSVAAARPIRSDGPAIYPDNPPAPADGPPVPSEAPPVRLLTVPRPETGEARVDAALSLLDDLTELPVAEHPAVFERVHAQLSEVLGELGSGPLTGPPGRDGG